MSMERETVKRVVYSAGRLGEALRLAAAWADRDLEADDSGVWHLVVERDEAPDGDWHVAIYY